MADLEKQIPKVIIRTNQSWDASSPLHRTSVVNAQQAAPSLDVQTLRPPDVPPPSSMLDSQQTSTSYDVQHLRPPDVPPPRPEMHLIDTQPSTFSDDRNLGPVTLPLPNVETSATRISRRRLIYGDAQLGSGNNQLPIASASTEGVSPRELRKRAEKQRRDQLSKSISELETIVPSIASSKSARRMDKTSVLRHAAHFLRAHHYVFGDAIGKSAHQSDFSANAVLALLEMMKGFLLTTTYRGLVVVVSQNVQRYLGYSDGDLLGQNILTITHRDDHLTLMQHLWPNPNWLGPYGELKVPEDPEEKQTLVEKLAKDKRKFVVRFKKCGQKAEPASYVTCYVEGSLRKSDRACQEHSQGYQPYRRGRVRRENPQSSGNDVVFVGFVRPMSETFLSESHLETFMMEYRTRHSVDGEIIECDQRICLVTGYMIHEVHGVNAMNFMHRDDVRWVVVTLREMYDQRRLVGESCYRLMAKNGQFIYMKTKGRLDVDPDSGEVRSFVCVNTAIDEEQGKRLIKMMKQRIRQKIIGDHHCPLDDAVAQDETIEALPVEDPKQLEEVILQLVTDLPSPQPENYCHNSLNNGDESISPTMPLTIIPPKKEKIVTAIGRIYNVIKSFQRPSKTTKMEGQDERETNKAKDKKSPAFSTSSDLMEDTLPSPSAAVPYSCHQDDELAGSQEQKKFSDRQSPKNSSMLRNYSGSSFNLLSNNEPKSLSTSFSPNRSESSSFSSNKPGSSSSLPLNERKPSYISCSQRPRASYFSPIRPALSSFLSNEPEPSSTCSFKEPSPSSCGSGSLSPFLRSNPEPRPSWSSSSNRPGPSSSFLNERRPTTTYSSNMPRSSSFFNEPGPSNSFLWNQQEPSRSFLSNRSEPTPFLNEPRPLSPFLYDDQEASTSFSLNEPGPSRSLIRNEFTPSTAFSLNEAGHSNHFTAHRENIINNNNSDFLVDQNSYSRPRSTFFIAPATANIVPGDKIHNNCDQSQRNLIPIQNPDSRKRFKRSNEDRSLVCEKIENRRNVTDTMSTQSSNEAHLLDIVSAFFSNRDSMPEPPTDLAVLERAGITVDAIMYEMEKKREDSLEK